MALELKALNREAWDRAVGEHPHALLFHFSDWLEAFATTHRHSLKRLAVYQGQEVVGLLPIFVGRYGPLKIAGSPLIAEECPYLGPAVAPGLLAEALRASLPHLERAKFFRILPAMGPEMIDRLPSSARFAWAQKHTHCVDLTKSEEKMWESMEGRCRTAIRKAEKSGFEVVTAGEGHDSLTWLQQHHALLTAVYARQDRMPPNPYELFEKLWQRFHHRGMLDLIAVMRDGRCASTALIGHYKGQAYYLSGAADRQFANLNPTNLVLWEAMKRMKASGCQSFDFVGSDVPRLAQFKASFGGEERRYWSCEWSSSAIMLGIRRWYGRYGKLMVERIRPRRRDRPASSVATC